jgi:hypothetical protein
VKLHSAFTDGTHTWIIQGTDAAKCGEALAKHWLSEHKKDKWALGLVKPMPAHGDCVRLIIGPHGKPYKDVVKRFAKHWHCEMHEDDPTIYGDWKLAI